MKTLYIHFLKLVVVLCATTAFSQNNNLNFTITSNVMDSDGTSIAITSTITKSNFTLSWVQQADGNTNETIFNIESIDGTWDTQNSTGNLTYTASVNGIEVLFTLTGNLNSGLTSKIEIIDQNSENEILTIAVNELIYL